MKDLAFFCLVGVLASALTGQAQAGQTKNDNGKEKGAWYESAVNALPGIEDRFGDLIQKNSQKYDVPEKLLTSIIAVESLGDPETPGGVMQVSRGAAKSVGVSCKTIRPACSIEQGAAYLRHLRDTYDLSTWMQTALAYNRGPSAAQEVDDAHQYEYVRRVSFVVNHPILTNN